MGIDYSSSTGYGFKVDEEKLRQRYTERFENDSAWEALEDLCGEFTTLSFAGGSGYDEPEDFAVVVRSTHRGGGWRDRPFGVFMLTGFALNALEETEVRTAYELVGTGTMGSLAVFNCS